MEAVRESWTDERLDHFRERVEQRFDAVDRRFDEVDRRFDEVDRRFEAVDRRFDKVEVRLERVDGSARLDTADDGPRRDRDLGGDRRLAGIMGLLATQL